MNPVVKLSVKAMEKGIPLVHRIERSRIEEDIMTSNVYYVYNHKGGVVEVWIQGRLDPGKKYHSWTVVTPIPLLSENVAQIVDYHAPEGLTLEARENLEDAVRLWNDKHGYSHVLSG